MTAPAPGTVVVSGMGIVCSIGSDVETFEAALREGRSGIQPGETGADDGVPGAEIRGFDLGEALARRGALPQALRDAARRTAGRSPFAVQVAVAAALEAWEHADLHQAPVPGTRLGLVVAGNNLVGRYAWGHYQKFVEQPAYLSPRFALQYQDTDHVGVLSQVLGIRGEGFTVGGASASGNVGIIHGSRLVECGAAEACLVVGALSDLSPMEKRSFQNLGAMAGGGNGGSPPFDQRHRGFVYGQAAACLVLESRRSARQRGRGALAELAGYAQGLDAGALADPTEEGEVRAMAEALHRAGRDPGEVTYVSAHGSGSALGDEVEARAIRRVLGRSLDRPWINATKGLTGHCLSAAGVVEAVATVVQMRGGFVHPNLGLERPIDAELRFVGPRSEAAEIRCALSNSFGFGGFNSSVVLVAAGA